MNLSLLKNPDDVERLLEVRRLKMNATKLPPPDRAGMSGTLQHPQFPGIVSGWFTISVAKAIAWLDHNNHNRKLSKHKVSSFARQHANGEFVATHQGIAFNDADELIDGQHTLKMIIATGQPLTRMVTFGLPKKVKNFHTMDVIDVGGRSVSDQLKISHGITESGPKKQICIALASICHGARTRNLQVGETLRVLNEFKASIEFVLEQRSKLAGLRQAGVLAGFAFAHATLGVKVEKWFEELNSGKGLLGNEDYLKLRKGRKPARPLDHLRQFLTSPESALFSKAMNRAIAEVTLQAIYGEAHNVKTQALEQAAVGTKWFANKQRERVERIAALFRSPLPELRAAA
jgi:hypothetical protein